MTVTQTRSPRKTLRRVPGLPLVVTTEIVPTPVSATKKADPNGYYEVLGLDPSRDYTDEEVKRAYWSKAKKFHPDGSTPDEELFRRVQTAYSVLSDPEERAKYDALQSDERWLDEEVIAAILKNLLPSGNGDAIDIIKKGLASSDTIVGPPTIAPPGPQYDEFVFYHYDGEDVPEQLIRDSWAACIVAEMIERGESGDVRLGFTTGRPHVIDKPWGRVMMASGTPSSAAAQKLVAKFLK